METVGNTASLTIRRTVKAARQTVFAAWTTPEALRQWSAPGPRSVSVVEVDLRVGGRFRIDMQAPGGEVARVVGQYVTIDPPARLSYTWFWETNPSMGESLVTVEFFARGAETEVVLTHERLPAGDAAQNHDKGWAGCLAKLDAMFPGA